MNKVLRIITALPGILFIAVAARWVFDPAGSAGDLGMPLLDGVGRSTQLGDLTSFFLSAGTMILLGVILLQRTWLFCAALLMGGAAFFRTLAWLVHDAALAADAIALEVVVAVLMLVAASKLKPA